MVAHNPSDSRGGQADPKEPENTFYYDNDLKIWRERGVEPPPPPEEPPPPPTTMPSHWQNLAPGASAGAPPVPSPYQHGGVGRYANAMGTAANIHSSGVARLQPPHSALLSHPTALPSSFMPGAPHQAPFVAQGVAAAYAPIKPEEMTEVEL